MGIIKFRSNLSSYEIKEIICSRESESSVWILDKNNKEHIHKKNTQYLSFHSTHKKAKQHLLNHLNQEKRTLERSLKDKKQKIKKVNGLTQY